MGDLGRPREAKEGSGRLGKAGKAQEGAGWATEAQGGEGRPGEPERDLQPQRPADWHREASREAQKETH